MGPREKMPPFREFNWMKMPLDHVAIVKVYEEANFMQGLEGSIDTSHVGFLHRAYERGMWGQVVGATVSDTRPRVEIEPTTYGFRYGAVRQNEVGGQNVRVTPFAMPFYTAVPASPGETVLFHAYVPRDDTSNWAYDIRYRVEGPIDMDEHNQRLRTVELQPDFRKPRTYANKHLQDREAMRTKNFTGIPGIKNQDYAAVESMGPIVDRSREHLGASDAAVMTMRRLMLRWAQAVMEGQDPPGLDATIPSELILSHDEDIPADVSWRAALPLAPGLRPADESERSLASV
jgi:hypothetical protein